MGSTPHLLISNLTFGRHAPNIELSGGDLVARRTSGYQGIVFTTQPLLKGQHVQIQVDKVNPKWTSSVIVGITELSPDKIPTIPTSSLSLRNNTFVVASDSLYENGLRVKENFCSNLDNIQVGDVISVLFDLQGNVQLIFNGLSHLIRSNVSGKIWLFVDVYGEAEQVTLYAEEDGKPAGVSGNLNLLNNSNHLLVDSSSFCSDKGILYGLSDLGVCEYFQACLRFKASLCLPEAYFVPTEPPICFCVKCMQVRGEDSLKEQGDPMEKHTTPKNWARFPININFDMNNTSCDQSMMTGLMTNSTSSLSNVLTTWHVAFYGLPVYQVRQVMDYGQLRFPEVYDASSDGGATSSESTKDDNKGSTELVFSPIIHYASLDDFASPKRGYVDSNTKQRLSVKTVLELLVQPGSYRTGAPSIPLNLNQNHSGTTSEIDKFDVNHIEWSTKEQGATHVAALLLCLEGFNTTLATATTND